MTISLQIDVGHFPLRNDKVIKTSLEIILMALYHPQAVSSSLTAPIIFIKFNFASRFMLFQGEMSHLTHYVTVSYQ